MKIPKDMKMATAIELNRKVEVLKKRVEKEHKQPVVLTEIKSRGEFCPHCNSVNLEHDSKYPQFKPANWLGRGAAIIFMTKCLSCGMLFDEPRTEPEPWVIFRMKSGIVGYNLKEVRV